MFINIIIKVTRSTWSVFLFTFYTWLLGCFVYYLLTTNMTGQNMLHCGYNVNIYIYMYIYINV